MKYTDPHPIKDILTSSSVLSEDQLRQTLRMFLSNVSGWETVLSSVQEGIVYVAISYVRGLSPTRSRTMRGTVIDCRVEYLVADTKRHGFIIGPRMHGPRNKRHNVAGARSVAFHDRERA